MTAFAQSGEQMNLLGPRLRSNESARVAVVLKDSRPKLTASTSCHGTRYYCSVVPLSYFMTGSNLDAQQQ